MPAKNLLAGRGYVDDQGRPYSFRPPTYPLFLAVAFGLTGGSFRGVQTLQALLAAAGVTGLAFWVGRRAGWGAGMGAGLLLGLDPLLVPVPAFLLTEALGTLLVPAILVCLDQGLMTRRYKCFALAGLLGGAAALNTPITLLLIPWLLLATWALPLPRRPAWGHTLLALAVTAACVGLWTARNIAVRGEAILVRDNGFGSLIYAATEYDFDWLPSAHEPAYAAVQRKIDALGAGLSDSQGHWVFLRAAWQNFRTDPLLVIKRLLKANFWFWVEVPGYYVGGGLRPVRWINLIYHQMQLVALAIAVWALRRAGRLREWALWVFGLAYFPVFLSVMMPIPRYYVPVLPVVDTLIVLGLVYLAASPEAPPNAASSRGAAR